QLLPLLGGDALRKWANCAEDALHDRDTRAIQHDLPALMKACDDLVLDAFAPLKPVAPEDSFARERLLSARDSAIGLDEVQEARPGVEGHGVRASDSANRQGEEQETHREVEGSSISTSALAHWQNEVLKTHLGLNAAGVGASALAHQQNEVLETHFGVDGADVSAPASAHRQDEVLETHLGVEGADVEASVPGDGQNEVLGPHLVLDEASSGAEGHGVSAVVPVNRQAEVLATRFGLDGQGVGPPPSGCPVDEASVAYRPVKRHGNRASSLEAEVGATGAVSEDAKAPEAQASLTGPGGGPSVDGLPGASGLRA
ncbi:hypothetical protein ACQKGO_30525, partial [Corallococcus interemptor]